MNSSSSSSSSPSYRHSGHYEFGKRMNLPRSSTESRGFHVLSNVSSTLTNEIGHGHKENDDLAFIFNRNSLNDFFNSNRRTQLKEIPLYTCMSNKSLSNQVKKKESPLRDVKITEEDEDLTTPVEDLKRPTCLPLNHFKKETSI